MMFVLFSAERSQDSEVVMLSDSNSTQDAFTDPASSQDSSHKPASGKASSSSSESTTPVKDGQSASEDTGTSGGRRRTRFLFNRPFCSSYSCKSPGMFPPLRDFYLFFKTNLPQLLQVGRVL